MKSAFLLFACLSPALFIHAQASASTVDQNRITITVSNNNSLSISSKNKEVTVQNNAALDSCLQKMIPDLDHPTILLDAPNDIDPEKHRAIGVILEKFHCPVMNFRRFEPLNPPATRGLDSVKSL